MIARNPGRAPGAPRSVATVRRELEAHAMLGARVIFLSDPEYPALLAELPDAPPMIAV